MFVGEAVYQATVNHDGAVAGLLLVIGVVLTPLFARFGTDHVRAAIAFVPVSVVGVGVVGAAYAAVNAV